MCVPFRCLRFDHVVLPRRRTLAESESRTIRWTSLTFRNQARSQNIIWPLASTRSKLPLRRIPSSRPRPRMMLTVVRDCSWDSLLRQVPAAHSLFSGAGRTTRIRLTLNNRDDDSRDAGAARHSTAPKRYCRATYRKAIPFPGSDACRLGRGSSPRDATHDVLHGNSVPTVDAYGRRRLRE